MKLSGHPFLFWFQPFEFCVWGGCVNIWYQNAVTVSTFHQPLNKVPFEPSFFCLLPNHDEKARTASAASQQPKATSLASGKSFPTKPTLRGTAFMKRSRAKCVCRKRHSHILDSIFCNRWRRLAPSPELVFFRARR